MDSMLGRIEGALEAAGRILRAFAPGAVSYEDKGGGDPVTEADRRVNEVLRELLPREGEGWLSEETVDDLSRLDKRRVWVVDPLDGTREFVAGIPEWCVSIGLVEDGQAVAGGVFNPQSGELFVGGMGHGVAYNGRAARMSERQTLSGGVVLASRSEVKRGEWERFRDASFDVRPVGSVAYKLALVAAGLADATWTLVPKHEWDVAAGVALVTAAGGAAYSLDGQPPRFNQRRPLLSGLVAHAPALTASARRATGIEAAAGEGAPALCAGPDGRG